MKSESRTISRPQEYVVNDWPCPECGSKTITWRLGTQFEGSWDCVNDACGASDVCEHPSMHVESVEVTSFATPDIDRSYERQIYVCDVCNMDIDLDVADPLEDKADYEADLQIMEALGK